MRPDPQQRRIKPDSGRIIYIGDVRRRRGAQTQTPDRFYVVALVLVAFMSWATWLTVVMSLAPSRVLSYLAFFTPLAVALVSTNTVGIYAIDWKRGVSSSLKKCFRRAVLISAVVETNLAFLGARLWLVPIAAGTIAAAALIEVVILARER